MAMTTNDSATDDSARTREEPPIVKSEDRDVEEEGKIDSDTDKRVKREGKEEEEEEEEEEDPASPEPKKLFKEEGFDDEDPNNEDSASPNTTKKRIKKEEQDDPEDASPSPGTTNQRRKRTKTSVKDEEPGDDSTSTTTDKAPSKKKRKGPRVKPELIQHVAKQMLAKLIENYKDGIEEVPMDVLAASIQNKKGQPYTNYRSDAIAEGIKLLKAQDKARKVSHGETGAAKLLPEEIANIPKEIISKDPQKVLEQRRQQFLNRLADHKKGGKGTTVVTAAHAVFDKLSDGRAYSRKELVQVTPYKATNSSGFEGIMLVLKEIKYIDNSGGKCAFTDKVFPHGRP